MRSNGPHFTFYPVGYLSRHYRTEDVHKITKSTAVFEPQKQTRARSVTVNY